MAPGEKKPHRAKSTPARSAQSGWSDAARGVGTPLRLGDDGRKGDGWSALRHGK